MEQEADKVIFHSLDSNLEGYWHLYFLMMTHILGWRPLLEVRTQPHLTVSTAINQEICCQCCENPANIWQHHKEEARITHVTG
jgi:hypothetical protein